MKRTYIIGKVSDLPRAEVVIKFEKAAQNLKNMGMVPVNPVAFVAPETEWNEAMKICIRALIDCDMILLLPDWQESKGATLEVSIARNLEMPELRYVTKESKV